jgi:hypothetical protein
MTVLLGDTSAALPRQVLRRVEPKPTGLDSGESRALLAHAAAFSSAKDIDIREISVGPEVPFVVGEGGGGGYFTTNDETGIFLFLNASLLGQYLGFGAGIGW